MEISIVIPVYGCKETLEELIDRLEVTLNSLGKSCEIILVEDGCPDLSWNTIIDLCKTHKAVTGIKLSRNFGQHEAITAGLEQAGGQWIIVMDCDLQDMPEEIPNLYRKALEGYEVVFGFRKIRHDKIIKRVSSRFFYSVLGYMTDTTLDPSVANFGIYNRKVIKAILSMKESLRFFPVMVRWVGFRSTGITVKHSERMTGDTTYTWRKLIRLALGVIVSFSDKPLRMIVEAGLWMSVASVFSAVFIVFKALFWGVPVQGWSSLMVSLWFIGGLLMSMLGVVGLYVGKTFDETKGRPKFIIDEITCD